MSGSDTDRTAEATQKTAVEIQQEQISISEMQEFLRINLPKFKCIGCENQSFDMLSEPDHLHMAQVHMITRGFGFFPSAVFMCENCGYINHLSWAFVKNWLEKQGGADA